MTFAAGDRVSVRGERWVVEDATAFADATLLELASADDAASGRRCRLLSPFDRPVAITRRPAIRGVTRRRWMHRLNAQLAEVYAYGELRAPQRAAIDVLPFQLEPALALVRGHASRFLLADEVGLGKTIQAGLMLAELRLRGWCEHALIVAPAGLRQQWADELLRRFDVRAAVIDAASLAALTDSLPFDVNPWSVEPVAITSIDFLKQPEVLLGAASLLWDALIVDEAHHATVASLRYDAVTTLAQRSRHVMLLTATPHGGDDRDYRGLCSIGGIASPDAARDRPLDAARGRDDPILLFRRTREAAGLPRSRRAHLLPVQAAPATADMHRLLDGYLAQLWTIGRESGKRDVQLAAIVLAKRAFSSARSLAISLERRMAGLSGLLDPPFQSALPFTFEDDLSDEAPLPLAPAFARADEERAIVQRLIDAARRAEGNEPKMRALRRIVRRVREPLIIFTEYRDTLDAIRDAIGGLRQITALHGGQTPHEQRQAVNAFMTGAADALLATDAGSEGLNLQGCCRLVINLELPWSPIRLEQRIGRVDRIGQTRTVHAINLLADGTAERTVLANLLRRIDRIRLSEIDIATSVIGRSEPPPRSGPGETIAETIDLTAAAGAETIRINQTRRVNVSLSGPPDETIPVTVHPSADASLIAFYRVRLVSRAGRLVEDALVPVRIPIAPQRRRLKRRDARALAESCIAAVGTDLSGRARAHAEIRARAIERASAAPVAQVIRRERAIADHVAPPHSRFVQASLFDSRALRQKHAADQRSESIRRESEARATLLEGSSRINLANEPELVMLLILCSRA